MSKKIVDKFFTNQTTPDETRRVLEWFESPEGKIYLQNRLDVDFDLMDRKELKRLVPELNSEVLYSAIQQSIHNKRNVFSLHHRDWIGSSIKAAAAILVILTASLFHITQTVDVDEQLTEREPVIFQTEDEEQSNITLRDGSVVRLNSNSEIIVSGDFLEGTREITLTGEAYFDIEHDPEQPFIVHANESFVEVLGTAFNLRSQSGQDNIQVAVVEGRVAFRSTNGSAEAEQLAVTLAKGQYGYMDITERTIQVDDMAVENYLAWKEGRFKFDGMTLAQVCTQLNRMYGKECSFESEEIANLQLTSNFSNDSMEKTMEVIAMSLEIEYETDGDRLFWREKNSVNQK